MYRSIGLWDIIKAMDKETRTHHRRIEEIKRQLQAYIDLGITHFLLWFMDAPDTDGMRLFSEQVAPAFKVS